MKKIIICFIAFIIILAGSCSPQLSNAASGDAPLSSKWEGYKSWHKVTGDKPMTGNSPFLSGKHRGENGYRVIYINSIGEATNQSTGAHKYPEGTVLVKEQYKNKSSFESNGKPELNIMVKLAEGTSPQTGDWGFVAGAKGSLATGTSGDARFCGGCHSGAALKQGDYVFTNAKTLK